MKSIVILKHTGTRSNHNPVAKLSTYRFELWRPSLFKLIPPKKKMKYIIYWCFHYFKVFRNNAYSSGLLWQNNTIVSSYLIVPAYYKWPFMEKNDVQFTYVITEPNYRKKGLALIGLQQALDLLYDPNRTFWWATDYDNDASIALAKKLGFEVFGIAMRSRFLRKLKVIIRIM